MMVRLLKAIANDSGFQFGVIFGLVWLLVYLNMPTQDAPLITFNQFHMQLVAFRESLLLAEIYTMIIALGATAALMAFAGIITIIVYSLWKVSQVLAGVL